MKTRDSHQRPPNHERTDADVVRPDASAAGASVSPPDPKPGASSKQHAEQLVRSGRPEEAIPILAEAIRDGADESGVFDTLARAHYFAGDFETAAKYAKWSIETFADRDIGMTEQSNDANDQIEALTVTRAILADANVETFLTLDTLLTCVRHGAPRRQDRIITLGFFSSCASNADVLAALQNHGGFVTPVSVRDDDTLLTSQLGDIEIELYRHSRIGRRIWFGASRRAGDVAWTTSAFDLTNTVFFGMRFLTPAPVSEYLSEVYGDWRSPAKAMPSSLASPALSNPAPQVFTYICLAQIRSALIRRDIERFAVLYSILPPELRNLRPIRAFARARSTDAS